MSKPEKPFSAAKMLHLESDDPGTPASSGGTVGGADNAALYQERYDMLYSINGRKPKNIIPSRPLDWSAIKKITETNPEEGGDSVPPGLVRDDEPSESEEDGDPSDEEFTDPNVGHREAVVTRREDPFCQLLSTACGMCSFSLADMFVALQDPPDGTKLSTYREYKPFLASRALTAIRLVNGAILTYTENRIDFEYCVNQDTEGLLFLATAKYLGVLLRKSIMDNPIKTSRTVQGNHSLNIDLAEALDGLHEQLCIHLTNRSRWRKGAAHAGGWGQTHPSYQGQIGPAYTFAGRFPPVDPQTIGSRVVRATLPWQFTFHAPAWPPLDD